MYYIILVSGDNDCLLKSIISASLSSHKDQGSCFTSALKSLRLSFSLRKTALFDLCEILTRFSNRNILSCRDKEVSSCPFHCQAVCDKECEYKETSVVVVLSASVSLKLLFFTHSFIDSLIESSYKSLEVNHVLFTLPSFSKETAYFPSHDPSLRLHYFVYSLDLLSMMSRHKLSMPK